MRIIYSEDIERPIENIVDNVNMNNLNMAEFKIKLKNNLSKYYELCDMICVNNCDYYKVLAINRETDELFVVALALKPMPTS